MDSLRNTVWQSVLADPGSMTQEQTTILALCLTTAILLWSKLGDWNVFYNMKLLVEYLFVSVPTLDLPLTVMEKSMHGDASDDTKMPSYPKDVIQSLKDPNDSAHIQCFDPSTGNHLGKVKAMTNDEVNYICRRAKEAQKIWCQTSYRERRKVLRTLQKYIVTHIDDICRVCTRDSGKTPVDALLGEVMTTCEKIRCVNSNGELWLLPQYRPTGPMMVHKNAYVEYVPFGVLGIIAPWNYPFHNLMNHVISGLFSGNAVVSKVSEHTSWSSANYFSRMVHAALVANGHNPDLVQVVTGFGDAGAALVDCNDVDKIIFTGSPQVGRLVMKGCAMAPSLKPVVLELGGKDPMVLCDDVKLEEVMPWAMRGCFQNCGQNCCGVERIFVYESIHDEFVDNILQKIKALRQGPPLCKASNRVNGPDGMDCGSMVMDSQCDLIQELIDDAVSKGAKVHCGGKRNAAFQNGQFYEPTLISGIDVLNKDMRICSEEVFGPVMCVIKVPNNDDELCLQMINDPKCSFGLGSSVYSGNKKRAEALGRRIRSGMFTANDFGVNYLIQSLPFGGVGESGFGRFAGPEGLRACCLERSVVVDRIPFVKTSIPPPIDYPISTKRGMAFGSALINLFYNESFLFGKLMAIIGLIKNG
jgi:acyl-CoA reductase-like NAD-dependent aldehyde dehydrogenase